MEPAITLIPARPLASHPQTVDVLVRITAPRQPQNGVPALDLVLALDTSGSMNGLPLDLARQAAEQVFHQRGAAHLGLVTFDSEARVAAPLSPWENDSGFLTALAHLRAGGSTALYGGWSLAQLLLTAPLGGRPQVPHRLQRVLLLTDGRANVGPRQPGELAATVRHGLSMGVSTSTVGVGRHYDEQLLEVLSGEGDGTYHYAETPQDLSGLFLSELAGLQNNFGRLVSLGLEGAEVLDVLNDFTRLPNGRTALPPLQAGRETEVLVRVRAKAGDALQVRLAWTDAAGRRHVAHAELTFPLAASGPASKECREVVQLRGTLELARLQRHIARLTDRDHLQDALLQLGEARGRLLALHGQGIEVQAELAQLDHLQSRLQRGDRLAASKLARSQAYLISRGER